jgi:hypothetical protein
MESFQADLESWQLFYNTVALSAAALTGLLFVSLSLHFDRLKGAGGKSFLIIARRTFGDFLYILMIALVFLVPHPGPLGLAVALGVLGLARGIGLAREVLRSAPDRRRRRDGKTLAKDISLPLVASLGLLAVAGAVLAGWTVSIFGLVIVIAALMVSACWNAWLLLIWKE